MDGILWMILFVIFLIIEACTVGLTAIWMAGGCLAAFVAQRYGAGFMFQFTVFFIVSLVLFVFTKPFVQKYVNKGHTKTNYEELIGKNAKVTETIDNINNKGTAVLNGQEWTARSSREEEIIEKDTIVKVVRISGVKLIVQK